MPLRRALLPLLLLALPLAGCGADRPDTEDFLEVVPEMVAAVEAEARENAPGRPAQGPLIVDAGSFSGAWALRARTQLDSARVIEALGRPEAEVARPDEVMLCDESELGGGCWIRSYGVFVHLNVVRRADDEISALVTGTVTDRRAFPTWICERVWGVTFRRDEAGAWSLAERELRRDC